MCPMTGRPWLQGFLVAVLLLAALAAAYGQDEPCDYWIVDWIYPADATAPVQFGDSVSIDGPVLAVGAPLMTDPRPAAGGAVYLFRSGPPWEWNEEAELFTPTVLSGVHFGDSVAIRDDVLVVGASDMTDAAQGAACVYRYDGHAWKNEANVLAAGGGPGERFGVAVALGPDVFVVGAPNADAGAGAAYVFRRNGTWVQEAKLAAADGVPGDHFGWSVAMDGETVLIGAPDDDDHGVSSGAAYFFQDSAAGWSQAQKISASNGAAGDRFGLAVALAGEVALIGAPTPLEGSTAGVAYVYRRTGGQWLQEAQLRGEANGRFRQVSVALRDNFAVVGANGSEGVDEVDGRAWTWRYEESAWKLRARLGHQDAWNDSFGVSVAISPDTAVVGALKWSPFTLDAGSVCTFRGLSDCNGNGILDGCEIAADRGRDCDGSGLPDGCDIADGSREDCNGNGVPDVCDLNYADQYDCNENGLVDACEIRDGVSPDCNANGLPDACDLAAGTSHDCNGNGILDECDIAAGTSVDCNSNGIPDECDLATQDCNHNGVPDACDIAAGTSQDTKLTGIPDECVSDACPLACQLTETVQLQPPPTDYSPAGCGDFGARFAISGPVLAVAAPMCGHDAEGMVFIYRRTNGVWAWEDTLSGSTELGFGTGLAVDGDTLVASKSGGIDVGDCWTEVARYVDGAWVREAIIDHLGLAVAIDGDVIVLVGQSPDICRPHYCWDPNDPNYDPVECGVPHPWVYRRQAGTWQLEARLEVPGATGYDRAAALSGNMAAVSTGGVWHLFRYDGGTWTDIQTLPAGSLSIDGDTLALGGAMQAQVYGFDGSTWTLTATLVPACVDAGFGKAVSLSGDTLLVASNYAVHAFVRQAGAWTEVARLTPGDGTYAIQTLALSDGTAAVSLMDDPAKAIYLLTGLSDPNGTGVLEACADTGPADEPANGVARCGVGACGTNVLGWLPMTLLGLGILKTRAGRRGGFRGPAGCRTDA